MGGKMKLRISLFALATVFALSAQAAQINGRDVPETLIDDPATGLPVDPLKVGGSFQRSPTITVQNAAYSAGNSLGGLITVTGAARTSGGTGSLMAIRLSSAGGSTNTIWVYAWSKMPQSTCPDKAAFSRNAADSPYALPGFPQSITLASPGSFDTASYASINNIASQFKNQDTSPGTAIYVCLVTAGSVTPASTSDLVAVFSGVQD